MSNDTLDTPVYDASKKTNILSILSLGTIQKLPGIVITDANQSADEFKHQYKIPLPPTIEKAWEKHGAIEFGDLSSEHSYNSHTAVKKFCFSPGETHFRLYSDLKYMIPDSSRSLFDDLKEIIRKCVKTYGELQEIHNNEFYAEVFFFDALGNMDSLRFSGSHYEDPIAEFIQFIFSNKKRYLDYIQKLNDDENRERELARQKIQALKYEHPMLGPYMHRIPDYLEGIHERIEEHKNDEWQIHEGDLVIDGNWKADDIRQNSDCLLITGNLHVKGVYDGYKNTFSWVVVLGDMTADDVVSWYGLSVAGNLKVNGIIFIEHYLFPLELGGDLRARYLYDLSENSRWKDEYIEIYNDSDIIRNISPGLLAESITERRLATDFSATADCLLAGESAFRTPPLNDEIVEKILQYSDDSIEVEYTQEELIADMQLDALLALVIASYQDVEDAALDQLKSYTGQYGKYFDKMITWTLENQITD